MTYLRIVNHCGDEATTDDPGAAILAALILWDEAQGKPGHPCITFYDQNDTLIATIFDRKELEQ